MNRTQQSIIRWVGAVLVIGLFAALGLRSEGLSVVVNRAAGQSDRTATAPIRFDVSFSEPVTGFTATDVSLDGSTATGDLRVRVNGSGSTYEVTVLGMTGPGTVATFIPAGSAVDASGHRNTTSVAKGDVVTFERAPQVPAPVSATLL